MILIVSKALGKSENIMLICVVDGEQKTVCRQFEGVFESTTHCRSSWSLSVRLFHSRI